MVWTGVVFVLWRERELDFKAYRDEGSDLN